MKKIIKKVQKIVRLATVFLVVVGFLYSPLTQIQTAYAADVTIDAASVLGTSRCLRSTVWTSATTGYFFFIDSDSDLKYYKTTNSGSSWGSPVVVKGTETIHACDVWYDKWTPGGTGDLIHVWYFGVTADDVIHESINTASADAQSAEHTVFNGATSVAGRGVFVSGARARGGNMLVAFDIDAGAEIGTYRSTDAGVTWGVRTNAVEATIDQAIMFPGGETDTQDMWMLYHDASADALTLKMHDDSANTNSESATIVTLVEQTTDGTGQYAFAGTIRDSDNHLLAVTASSYDSATGDMQTWDINGTASITQKTAISTDKDDTYYPSIYTNNSTDETYVAYIGKSDGSETLGTTNGVYYKTSTDGMANWSSEVTYSDSVSDFRQTWVPIMGPRFNVIYRDLSDQALYTNYVNSSPWTVLGDGTDGASSTVAPGASATEIGRFSLRARLTADIVTGMTVTLAGDASAYTNIATVDVQTTGGVSKCSSSSWGSDNLVELTSCAIDVTTSATDYVIKITPKTHANMPAVPGASYATTATVTSITTTYPNSGTDTDSATITVDNASTANVTSTSGSAGDTQVTLNYTNPADSDLNSIVVLRRAGTAVADVPVEGDTYTGGETIGTATVATGCVDTSVTPSAAENCTATGLSNGTAYHFKIFTKDSRGNYDAGVVPTGSPFTPTAPTFIVGGNVYEDEATAALTVCDGSGAMVAVSLNGAAALTGTCADANGAFSIDTGGAAPAAGTPIIIWVDGATACNGNNANSCGATIINYSGTGNITDAIVRKNRLVVRNDHTGSVANTDLKKVCNSDASCTLADADVVYEVDSSNNIVLEDNIKLIVNTSDTYTPGGTLTTSPSSSSSTLDGDISISTGATLAMGANALSVGGDFANSGTLSYSGNTTTFTATATGHTVEDGTSNFHNAIFNGSGGGWTLQSALTLGNNLTVTAGTLSSGAVALGVTGDLTVDGTLSGTGNVTANGTVAGTGTITYSSGTFLQSVTTDKNFGTTSGSTTWTFSSLTFTGTTDVITIVAGGTGGISLTGTLTVSAATTLGHSSRTITLSSTGTPFVVSGTYSPSSTATISYTGNGATATAGSYQNLELRPGGATQITMGAGTFNISGTLTVGNGANNGARADTNDPIINVTGATTIASGATFTTGDGAMNLSSDLNISGTLSGSGTGTITTNGTVNGAGTVSLTAGTFVQSVGVDTNFGTTSGSNNWSFNNLTFTGTTDIITIATGGTGFITVAGTLTVSANTTLAHSSRLIFLSGTGSPFSLSGTYSGSGTATLVYTGSGATISTTNATYFNLGFSSSVSQQVVAAGTLTVNGGMTVGNGTGPGATLATNNPTLNVASSTISANATLTTGTGDFNISGDLTVVGTLSGTANGTITVNGNAIGAGTVNLTSAGTFKQRVSANKNFGPTGSNNWTFVNLTFSRSGNTPTITTHTDGSGNVTVSGTLSVGEAGDGALTTLDPGDITWTLSSNGTPLVLNASSILCPSSTCSNNTSTINYTYTTGGGAVTVAGTNYYNLGVGTTVDANAATTFTLGGNTTVTNAVTIGVAGSTSADVLDTSSGSNYSLSATSVDVTSKGTLNANNSTITLSGATPFTMSGIFNPGGSTVLLNRAGNIDSIPATTYYNLNISPTTDNSYAHFSAFRVDGTLTLGNGSQDLWVRNEANNPTLDLRGNVVINSISTWTKSSNPITFKAGTSQTLTDNDPTKVDIGDVKVSVNGGNTTLTLGSSIKMSTLTIDDNQTFSMGGSNTLTLTAPSVTPLVIGTGSTFTASSGSTVDFTGDGALTVIPATTYHHLGLKPGGSTAQVFGSGTFTINGGLTIGDGTNVGATLATNNPTLNVASTTISSNATLTTGTGDFNISGDLTVSGTLSGTANGTITVNGHAIGAGTVNLTSAGTFKQRVSSNKNFGPTGSNDWTFVNLTFSRSGNTPTITTHTMGSGNVTVSNVLTVGEAGDGALTTLDPGDITWTLSGNGTPLVLNASSILCPSSTCSNNTSTVNYTYTTGGGAVTVAGTNYYNLGIGTTVDANAATTFTLGGSTILGGLMTVGNSGSTNADVLNTNNSALTLNDLDITSKGSFTAPSSANFVVKDDFTNSGTFTHSSGTIKFEDSAQTSLISGATTFNNFTSITPGKTLEFQTAGNPLFTFAGTLYLDGSDNSKVNLRSDSADTQWLAKFNSAQSSISKVNIGDSGCHASSASVNLGAGATNQGNNGTCWIFVSAEVHPGRDNVPTNTGAGGESSSGGGSSQGGGLPRGDGGSNNNGAGGESESGGGQQQGGGGGGGDGGGDLGLKSTWSYLASIPNSPIFNLAFIKSLILALSF